MGINLINPWEVPPANIEPELTSWSWSLQTSIPHCRKGWQEKGEPRRSLSLLHHVKHMYSYLFISTMLESDCCYFQLIDSVVNVSNLPQIWSLWVGKHLPLSFLVLNPTLYLPYSSQFVCLLLSTLQRRRHSLLITFCICSFKCYWFDYTLKLPHLSDTVFFYSQNGDNYCWLLDTSQE